MIKFSSRYYTYDAWLQDQTADTPYRRRIERLHKLHPHATLAQLRGHPIEVVSLKKQITPTYTAIARGDNRA